jgi:hypothetical protein
MGIIGCCTITSEIFSLNNLGIQAESYLGVNFASVRFCGEATLSQLTLLIVNTVDNEYVPTILTSHFSGTSPILPLEEIVFLGSRIALP